MSKKKIRQRVKDICSGAGLFWMEEESNFENFSMESIGRAVSAIIDTFEFKGDNRLVNPLYWDSLDNLDDMTTLVILIIENEGE